MAGISLRQQGQVPTSCFKNHPEIQPKWKECEQERVVMPVAELMFS
jgi:hypothetical protein